MIPVKTMKSFNGTIAHSVITKVQNSCKKHGVWHVFGPKYTPIPTHTPQMKSFRLSTNKAVGKGKKIKKSSNSNFCSAAASSSSAAALSERRDRLEILTAHGFQSARLSFFRSHAVFAEQPRQVRVMQLAGFL